VPGTREALFAPHALEPYPEEKARAALEGMPHLGSVFELASEYSCRLKNEGYNAATCDVATEAVERIVQLDYLLKCAAVVHLELMALFNRPAGVYPIGPNEYYRFLLTMYAESFYYFGHRLQDILSNRLLPFVESFAAVRGVTIVRNHLIEHPREITDRRPVLGGNFGIRLKDARRPDQPTEHRDEGLFVNAARLQIALEEAFTFALERWDSGVLERAREAHEDLKRAIAEGATDIPLTVPSLIAFLDASTSVEWWRAWLQTHDVAVAGRGAVYDHTVGLLTSLGYESTGQLEAALQSAAGWAEGILEEYLDIQGAVNRRGVSVDAVGIPVLVGLAVAAIRREPELSAENLGTAHQRLVSIARRQAPS
jgi:hypothetical protein